MHGKGRPSADVTCWRPAGRFDACAAPSPVSTCGRSQLFYVYRDPEESEKGEQVAPEKVLALEEIQGI